MQRFTATAPVFLQPITRSYATAVAVTVKSVPAPVVVYMKSLSGRAWPPTMQGPLRDAALAKKFTSTTWLSAAQLLGTPSVGLKPGAEGVALTTPDGKASVLYNVQQTTPRRTFLPRTSPGPLPRAPCLCAHFFRPCAPCIAYTWQT